MIILGGRRLIGLLGRAGSGKTTCAEYLRKEHNATIVSFAAPLKKMAYHLMGFSAKQVWGSQKDKEEIDSRYGFSAREFMVKLGTTARRELGEDVWVNALLANISQMNKNGLYVIDDVRFPNESQIISGIGGTVIKLVCPDCPQLDYDSEVSVDDPGHTYEAAVVAGRSHNAKELTEKFAEIVRNFL